MKPYKRRQLLNSPHFSAFLHGTPLPSDQKLLTLLHFNLVRALMQNVFILNMDPDNMSLEQVSPFTDPEAGIKIEALPEMLRPTELQRTVKHHPELDLFPFPEFRDNRIRHGVGHVEVYCLDLLYGVESCYSTREWGLNGRTGLIAWGEPWLQGSWEVEEAFARKYRHYIVGCKALLRSTNYWRKSRGEAPLVLELNEEGKYES
jgi:Domain of unknown function (DUF3425)